MAAQKVSGIYEIVNVINGKRYIGSAVNMAARWRCHRHDLNKGTHHSQAMQRAWEKYGPDAFAFRVRTECSREDLILMEQVAIDSERPEYNVSRIAGSPLGVRHGPEFSAKMRALKTGLKASDETRARMSEAHKGRAKSPEAIEKRRLAVTGRKTGPLSDEHKRAISAALKGRQLTSEHAKAISAGKSGRSRPDMVGNSWGSLRKAVRQS
ncbi:GIY-YIG nuclease family protein [Devosia sp.]|uniref:GIY-YIG nuclease family protein n=1 Tax=Devosia sp. TaxID=1871048 RepID=UPI001B042928|nr:GIY-YIG nuclease family protein [Devosia sp.]MBO9589544.1 GIY-YIG nuclease family protein [Devosia sp.]